MAEKTKTIEKPEPTVPPMADEPGGEGVKPAEKPVEKSEQEAEE